MNGAVFSSLLDEKQRRLYAGIESLKTDRGDDSRVAELLGLDVGTVAGGRRELLDRDVVVERIRKAGGGRKPRPAREPKPSSLALPATLPTSPWMQ